MATGAYTKTYPFLFFPRGHETYLRFHVAILSLFRQSDMSHIGSQLAYVLHRFNRCEWG